MGPLFESPVRLLLKSGLQPFVCDQNFKNGKGVVDGERSSSERCLKWGGGGH